MNVQEWINSGIIEAYVLGDLSVEEAREVEAMAERHPEVRDEIKAAGQTFEQLARKTAVTPRKELRHSILEAIPEKPSTDTSGSATAGTVTPTEKSRETPVHSISRRRSDSAPWKFALAASVVLFIIASVFAANYRGLWRDAEERLEDYIVENQLVRQDYQVLRSNYEQLRELQNVYADPAFSRIPLNGTEAFPSTYATVYWNPGSEEVYLAPGGLPQPQKGKQYQLWAIVDGEPRSAGMVSDLNGVNVMQQIDDASAFAITLEPEGGSEKPTLEAMYVLGEV
ncbi:anti-sigma factor domain-containing protein [Roseivirga sp. BDSF3-8]|uniref:anti-sigma factor n=1 Tax=Roseivirga sp. BDSF3-8 TaxID=3241598 RepID=UPI0035324077